MTYAPLIVFVYNRPDHTKQILQALDNNTLADQTDLIIFSDAAKTDRVSAQVEEVRNVIHAFKNESRFHSVEIHEAEQNLGCRQSIISGITEVLSKRNKAIIVEDDLLCRKNFLQYMNDALNMYEADSRIFSIGAHTKHFKELDDYPFDIFLTYRSCSWGWGIWKDRWDQIDWEVSDYDSFKKNLYQRWRFARGGADLYKMLENEMNGKSDAWDLRLQYAMAKTDCFTIYPKNSFTFNIGFDGSGTHCVDTGNEESDDLESMPYTLVPNIQFNSRVNRGFLHTEYPGIVERGKRKIRKMLKTEQK